MIELPLHSVLSRTKEWSGELLHSDKALGVSSGGSMAETGVYNLAASLGIFWFCFVLY